MVTIPQSGSPVTSSAFFIITLISFVGAIVELLNDSAVGEVPPGTDEYKFE